MPYQPNTPFNSTTRTTGTSLHSSTTGYYRRLASTTTTTTTTKPTSTPAQNHGFVRRLASTPRGRATLAAVLLVGVAVDYELWTLYGSKYFF